MISWFLCMMLIVAMALFTVGCGKGSKESDALTSETTDFEAEDSEKKDSEPQSSKAKRLGSGEKSFDFSVTDKSGETTYFEIRTDEKTVGEALLKLGLIAGEDSGYGLFVKKVNGVVADYDTDKTYWAFYVNGEYSMSGVDTTTIKEGESYAFKVEK